MEAARRNNENSSMIMKPSASRVVRKPLGVTTNRVLNVQAKASFKEKQTLGPLKEKQIAKPARNIRVTRSVSLKKTEVLEKNLPELEKNLPVIEDSHSTRILPDNVDNIDAEDAANPQLLSVYVNDIYNYLRILEAASPIKKNHLFGQPDITGKMRAVLVDWLVQVHLRFHLLQETLYMTVSILDRFLQIEKVKRSELQLVGVTAMFIASKYEEVYAPEVGDFVYITDNTYTKLDILKMERLILRRLDFNLSKPLPLHFLRRISKAGNVDATMHTLAKYVMEIILPEYEMAHYSPSLVAAASSFLAMKLLTENPWTETLKYYSHYSEEEVIPVVCCLCKLLIKAESSKLQAVHSKYASSKLMKISMIPELKSPLIKMYAEIK